MSSRDSEESSDNAGFEKVIKVLSCSGWFHNSDCVRNVRFCIKSPTKTLHEWALAVWCACVRVHVYVHL